MIMIRRDAGLYIYIFEIFNKSKNKNLKLIFSILLGLILSVKVIHA